MLPIIEKNKLIDFIHTSDLLLKKKLLKNFSNWWVGIYRIYTNKRSIKIKLSCKYFDINYYGCHLDKKTMLSPKLKIFL